MSLARGHVDVWCACPSQIADPVLLAHYDEVLSADEREREHRLIDPSARHRFRVTRALVRTTLSRYAPILPGEWTFATGSHGRPEIDERLQPRDRLSFNVSHSGDVVVCAVAAGCDVGVDVERVGGRAIDPGLVDVVCAEGEKQCLAGLEGLTWQQRFCELWTLKEAYLKARGAGLALPPGECAFDLQTGDATVVMSGAPDEDPSRWQFWLMRILGDHILAVCAERTHVPVRTVSLRMASPLAGDEPLAWKLLRSSNSS